MQCLICYSCLVGTREGGPRRVLFHDHADLRLGNRALSEFKQAAAGSCRPQEDLEAGIIDLEDRRDVVPV